MLLVISRHLRSGSLDSVETDLRHAFDDFESPSQFASQHLPAASQNYQPATEKLSAFLLPF